MKKKKKTWSQKNKETNIKTANPVTFNKMNKCGIFPSSLSGRWGGWLLLTKWHQMIHQQFTRVSLEPGVKNAKWLRKVADHTAYIGPGHRLPKGLFSPPGQDARFSQNNIWRPVIFEFQVTNSFLVYLWHPCAKNFNVYLKFKFNWEFLVFPGNPTSGTQYFSSFPKYVPISRFKLR